MKGLSGLLILFVFTLAGCNLEAKTLSQFFEGDFNEVNKITIVDGSTGYKKTITDIRVIEGFLAELKDIRFIPEVNQEQRDGWRYSIILFKGGEAAFHFGLTEVNDHYYYTKPDIHPIVDDFYKNLDVQEE
ncbi:hypothetical protein [Mesobacillus harenae]|uniref:hypothetical protein n=1 Tax=Mesobacillus harenae TaxID=2213203 RepID=UPI00157FFAB2|nr:hypothetical protein [Mesobacillus harenae]